MRESDDLAVIEGLLRDTAPSALAILLRRGERFADAEDAVQEAVLVALEAWSTRGVPDRPVGWMVRVAQRRLIDQHHRDSARRRREVLAASWAARESEPAVDEDDSLALLFLCCHSSLTPNGAIPLTLRAVGGLSTREIADALLVPEATIAQRISRAKASITRSGEPFRLPSTDLIDDRLASVMQVIYLIFNEGHVATSGPSLIRTDVADEAIHLARQLHERLPDEPEVSGLLALLLLTDARRLARVDAGGDLIPLDRQDRRLWDRAKIDEGVGLLHFSLAHHALGDYQLQASIAAVHDRATSFDSTDWWQLRALYDELVRRGDNPIVRLNRVVAVAHTDGPRAAQLELDSLAASLIENHRFFATSAYVHELAGELDKSRCAYADAARLATNDTERRYLQAKASG